MTVFKAALSTVIRGAANSAAPPLEGMNLDELPQQLTNAYASIVAARMRLRESSDGDGGLKELAEVTGSMRRLAFTLEALVSASKPREDRAAAAFVAGTAHHVSLMASSVGGRAGQSSHLGHQSISPEVSAALLFLIAEASADAAEMAKHIVVHTENPVEGSLLRSIALLSRGQLRKIIELPSLRPDQILTSTHGEVAVRTLYFMLFNGVRSLAARMLGETSSSHDTPRAPFERVRALCVAPLTNVFGLASPAPLSIYPGPLHLASLLSSVADDLSASALVNVAPPAGVDGARWFALMREIAEHRPYLWRNHRQAIGEGYLQPGVSSAISFPTGSGKSTLAELKIAAALLRAKKVVFLAPTVALVDQTARALGVSFRNVEIVRERTDELAFDLESSTLPAISVMTPERCLAMLSFDPQVFAEVGLLIFDECHLLHPREADRSRRAIDAMLCVLNFTALVPSADLLFLSAMMMNGGELAGWLQSLSGRPCLALSPTWKPTRQVRGCVVYSEAQIQALNAKLQQGRINAKTKAPPAALRRSLTVQPFGFFSLDQTWQSKQRKDYALIPLLQEEVTLSASASSANWYLTPNGNQVAAALAAATARKRLKTLVFTQTIPYANGASKAVSDLLGPPSVTLTPAEKLLYAAAVDEAGGAEYLYLRVSENDELRSSSAPHHGLLIPSERNLHESLFRRADGINVLVATSTLSQGMNLPSEVVIINGDSRFDPQADRVQQLEAHELLNAAGRAGRAGESSVGFVLVVPSKVLNFDDEKSRIHKHWSLLQAIFAQSDQCLTIDDPFTALLDQIHSTASPSELATYLIKRLPVGLPQGGDTDAPARQLLNRSFAAYRARAKGDAQWLQTRIDAALGLRRADPEKAPEFTWADRLAAAVAVPVDFIRELGDAMSGSLDANASVVVWRDWIVQWLQHYPHRIPQLIRRESLEGLFGSEYAALADNASRGRMAGPLLSELLKRWMAGETLLELELSFGTKPNRLGYCEAAREFVVRVVPELAYLFGMPAQVLRAMREAKADLQSIPLGLDVLGPCVKEGFDQVEKLALRHYHHGQKARRAVHREFASIHMYIGLAKMGEGFADVVRRVKAGAEFADLMG